MYEVKSQAMLESSNSNASQGVSGYIQRVATNLTLTRFRTDWRVIADAIRFVPSFRKFPTASTTARSRFSLCDLVTCRAHLQRTKAPLKLSQYVFTHCYQDEELGKKY